MRLKSAAEEQGARALENMMAEHQLLLGTITVSLPFDRSLVLRARGWRSRLRRERPVMRVEREGLEEATAVGFFEERRLGDWNWGGGIAPVF